MKKYIIDFQNKKTVVFNSSNKKTEATISSPELKNEITLPTRYTVSSLDDKLLGAVNSYLPEKNKIVMKNGVELSNLIIGGNGELILKTSDKRYDIGKQDLEDMAKSEVKLLKESGFSNGYKLRSSEETGELQFFEKEGKTRATLSLESSDYLKFLPIVMYEKIKNDVKGKFVKPQIPKIKTLKIKREIKEGPFVKFVKENFPPRTLEDAFSYQDQKGEKERFFEYLDHGIRPVVLNGPTGNGKSVLCKDYASVRKVPFYFDTGSNSFRISTAIGKFVPSPGSPTFSPGSLTLAAIHGGIYVLEEMPPIPQDGLTGLNIFLETGELPMITQFGHEVITADPRFKFVATGNFHNNYTTNELNDAFLQRFSQIKIGYPTKENTVDILQSRAPGLNYETAEFVADAVIEMRDEAEKFQKDLGLKGAVELVQRIQMGSGIPMRELFEENIVNPLTTYENNLNKNEGRLYNKLMEVVDKYI